MVLLPPAPCFDPLPPPRRPHSGELVFAANFVYVKGAVLTIDNARLAGFCSQYRW
jgi:hypothetical protein